MEDASSIDFSKVVETSLDTLRVSVDGTKTLLKFRGETPVFLRGLQEYNYAQILDIMRSEEWTPEQE
tara:strand:+ start:783 stop:983 length:201 start_codon:yes stop_codon:yes gene_type:complete